VILATYAFAFQIYCDFSGYSDIARGVSRCFGIELMVNFNVPYTATNPRAFWQRWHISLSTWLRDYLYVSLGGNRGGSISVYRNLMLTMLLGGLWHGARANFVLWGLYQGALLCGHRMLEPVLKKIEPKTKWRARVMRAVYWIAFFNLVCYGWLLFRADTAQKVVDLTLGLATGWNTIGEHFGLAFRLVWFCWLLILVQFMQVRSGNVLVALTWPAPLRTIFFVLLFYFTVIFGAYDEVEFIYFQF
jgi:D-alanyl-lipoteichoic acid acyltransferase DltB (MBOAT superfamily)